MNAANDNTILLPPGRLVQGSVWKERTEDMQGNPLTVKRGANKGQERVEFYMALAIPKTAAAWWDEVQRLKDGTVNAWGRKILGIAQAAWPQGQTQRPDFAWKLEDGDSAVPNKKGKKNCDRPGFKGCWIVKMSGGYAPKVFDVNNRPIVGEALEDIKPGFWIEVFGNVKGNDNPDNPGIYINHSMVCFRGRDEEIVVGPDVESVGFGRGELPAHVSMAPAGSVMPSPGVNTPPPAVGQTPPPAAATAPLTVAPAPSILNPPVAGAAAPVPPAAAAAPPPPAAIVACPLGAPTGFRMANPAGARYEAFTGQGWTNDQMLTGGHMVKV